MLEFRIHSPESAPEGSKEMLTKSISTLGFVPGLYGVLAESPKVLEAYQALASLFKTSNLTTIEQHVVWLTINVENECGYCVPAHSALAKMDGIEDEVVQSLRNGTRLADAKLESLRKFTLELIRNRGWVPKSEVEIFLKAGFEQKHILDVILGLSHKVISNYTNHLAQTPVDKAFSGFSWQKEGANDAESEVSST